MSATERSPSRSGSPLRAAIDPAEARKTLNPMFWKQVLCLQEAHLQQTTGVHRWQLVRVMPRVRQRGTSINFASSFIATPLGPAGWRRVHNDEWQVTVALQDTAPLAPPDIFLTSNFASRPSQDLLAQSPLNEAIAAWRFEDAKSLRRILDATCAPIGPLFCEPPATMPSISTHAGSAASRELLQAVALPQSKRVVPLHDGQHAVQSRSDGSDVNFAAGVGASGPLTESVEIVEESQSVHRNADAGEPSCAATTQSTGNESHSHVSTLLKRARTENATHDVTAEASDVLQKHTSTATSMALPVAANSKCSVLPQAKTVRSRPR